MTEPPDSANGLAVGWRRCWPVATLAVVFGSGLLAYGVYASHEPGREWTEHWLAGSFAGTIAMALCQALLRREVQAPLAWVVLGQVAAVIPDLMLKGGVPHRPWMNLFVGHLVVHDVPGPLVTWLAALAVASVLYLLSTLATHPAPST